MNPHDIRKLFPILESKVYGKKLVYLDNAATSQRPIQVIEKWNEITSEKNANIHRGVHHLSELATKEFELAREAVRDFVGAKSTKEIIFTSGTTASINLVAFSFGEAFIREGDEIIVSEAEHHSDIVPWQMLCRRRGAKLNVLKINDFGYLDTGNLTSLFSEKTKLLAITQISNVLGLINPIKEIVGICHENGVKVLVDGAQGVVHQVLDVTDADCDFYVFSGHKMFAATGTGVLYGKQELLEQMPPYMGGGEMISSVKFAGTTYADLPHKFEAGTQNFSGIPTFIPAIELIKRLNDKELEEEHSKIKEFVLASLMENDKIKLYGVPHRTNDKVSLFSISVKGIHHEDLALILDKMGIAVRSGQMCSEPLMDRFGVTGMLRMSFAPYNTMEEAEYLMKSLGKAIKMLE